MIKQYNPEAAFPQDERYDKEMNRNILCPVLTMKRGILPILIQIWISYFPARNLVLGTMPCDIFSGYTEVPDLVSSKRLLFVVIKRSLIGR